MINGNIFNINNQQSVNNYNKALLQIRKRKIETTQLKKLMAFMRKHFTEHIEVTELGNRGSAFTF